MTQPTSKHVFISYSRKDHDAMRRIVQHLRGQGIKAWVDNESLIPGTPVWEYEIEKAIVGALAVIVVLSPDAKTSEWVLREITLADEYQKRVFPVVVAGRNVDSIPFRLVTRQFADIRQNEAQGLQALSDAISAYWNELTQFEEQRKSAEDEALRLETERKAKEESDRVAKQIADEARTAAENADIERRIKAEAERLFALKTEEERQAKARADAERKARAEARRKAKEEAERLAAQKAGQERLAAEKAEEEQAAKARAERDRKAEEAREAKAEADRLAAQRVQEERLAKAKAEQQRKAQQDRDAKAEAERLAAQKAEKERLAKSGAPIPAGRSTIQERKPVSRGVMIAGFSVAAVVLLAVASFAISDLLKPTSTPTQEPISEAPEATEEPVAEATEASPAIGCPAITLTDMQGVAAGTWPQQYELEEFESAANCTMIFTDREFDQRLVETGHLPEGGPPPVEERLPEEPLVVVPYEEIGKYGGRFNAVSVGPEAGNSEWLSVRHVNLLRFLDDLQTIVPNMAKSYEWNDDFTELTITLRRGHKWSDGAPFTTQDILFWWEDIITNPDLYPEVPSYWLYGGEPMQVEAIDDERVKFTFAVPAPSFTTQLATTFTHLWAPKHYLQDMHIKYNPNADAEAKAQGFDSWQARLVPLYFFEWEDTDHILGVPHLEAWIKIEETAEYQIFVPNPYYYKIDTAGQQLPYFNEIEEQYAAEIEIFETKIVNGEIHFKSQSLLIGSLPLFQENQDQGNYDIQLPQGASNGRIYVFNATHKDPVLAELFSDPLWNRAMSLALNREEINQALCSGLCEPTQGVPVHRTVSFAKPEWFTKDIEYDPEMASAILDELGLERGSDGFRVRPDGGPLQINLLYSTQWGDPALHELAKEYWEAVGVRVALEEISTEAYRAMAANNEHDIQVTSSGTELEASLYSNPFRLFPPFGDAALEPLFGLPWVEWYNSGGSQGIEPPEDIKPLWELTDRWRLSLPGSDDYVNIGQQLVQVQMDRGMLIGTITAPPVITIVSRRLGNVPQFKVNAFEYYRTNPYRADQWFFKDANLQ